MKLKWSLPFFIILLIVSVAGLTISPIIFAQNNTNRNLTDDASTKSSNGSGSGGGMSTNSVDIAKSNSKDLSVNSTFTGNNSTPSNGSGSGGGMKKQKLLLSYRLYLTIFRVY
jgi:hypothetical protein